MPEIDMIYTNLMSCVQDLERNGHLIRIVRPVDPDLEMAAIHRRVYQAGGPAIFYERVAGSPFPAVSNLFGTLARSRFILRGTLGRVQQLMELAADPGRALKKPSLLISGLGTLPRLLPRRMSAGPVLAGRTTVGRLPQIRCWPGDGGAFVLLPQVYSELNGTGSGLGRVLASNLGMYRIQLAGNDYRPDREVGLHYQIRRDIGIHHAGHIARSQPLRVSIFVGGPPAHTLAAVMPLPEGLSELMFAGILAGRRFRYGRRNNHMISMDADFCITGSVDPLALKPEGPFGDHLGYYSQVHPFPFIRVEQVYHRKGAVWPFTVVGRPPQEDTAFGQIIHEITGPLVPKSIPGVKAVHAVDAAGVHPLMLAVGQERFVPYGERRPRELLTQASAILGFGHCSLAKFLLIVAAEDNPELDIHAPVEFLGHLLERVDWRRDLHFHTRSTIDTLDYSGHGFNAGSKVVMAAAGAPRRTLARTLPAGLELPGQWRGIHLAQPGIAVIQAPAFSDYPAEVGNLEAWCRHLGTQPEQNRAGLPLLILADDAEFTARDAANLLWVTFTRSDPARDIHGVGADTICKHWGCSGPLIIDARIKPHHAPELEEDPEVEARVDALGRRGGPLSGII